ncbi:CheY-like chemotaxis protein [Flavobacterium sp. 7E]|uniref:response regulator n=1 Tax=unclassified Flavobacterium TaxID=196869 RepID=UPI00156EB45C|nr:MULTISPECIES: response regulator [unclassified Flavobacterium]MBE0391381.1 Chemotaxis response regulator protein-glutamate methylesterase [Flavobacterium sp. PL002]NRS88179.1 CheY-like chemotaxis protein [Flavobacterium sp. 7E]
MSKSILLVDDDHIANFVNSKMILKNGICDSVASKICGREALSYLYDDNNVPSLIILDVNMPQMTGFDFLDQYYSYGFNKNKTSIMMLSSSFLDQDKTTAKKYDKVVQFLTKPLNEKTLQEIATLINLVS